MSERQAARPRRRWRRQHGVAALGGGLGLLAAVALVLLVLRPWAPESPAGPAAPGTAEADGPDVADESTVSSPEPREVVRAFYPAPGGRGPGLLVLGGSEGGLSEVLDHQARALRAEGYSVLAISYFGGEGQPQALEEIPLETFDAALDALAAEPAVDPDRLGLLGTSKGAEAALLVASTRSDLDAVVGMVPSSVVWQGLDPRRPWRATSVGSSWSEDGRPLPYLPYPDGLPSEGLRDYYQRALDGVDDHPQVVIPAEEIGVPVLLTCGEEDTLWPSCPMAEQVRARAEAQGGPPVTVLSYPDAGHLGTGQPIPADAPGYQDLDGLGGTVAGNAAAREESWAAILAYLDDRLGAG